MQITAPQTSGASQGSASPAYALDVSCLITKVASVKEARALPCRSIVGDLHGGLTFTDAVAAALELRSLGGWREIQLHNGDIWTIISLDR